MCGIVGLLIKKPELRESLGELMVPMLIGMSDRGSDSAGLAIFTETLADDRRKYSLYSHSNFDWAGLLHSLKSQFGENLEVAVQGNHGILTTSVAPGMLKPWLRQYPDLHVLSTGRTIDLYKDTGTPKEVCDRYQFKTLKGTHLVGHTRMATESAVTPAHAHPFTAGEDFCL
ncbi:MAG TPA: hypothetical protein V6D18_12260, partial [Thermosynechococcaceae cyanobacterium]